MTSAFRDFVCWREDAVLAVTPRDAASLTDGRFQAIHHPLRLRQRRLDQRTGGTWVTEADVLAALRGSLRPDGYLFVPVVGGSGTGKSHLVRWVKDQTEGEPGWEVRYLPKNRTGLRRAIEIVIRDLNGPRIEEAREALQSAPAHTESDEILAQRLLDELALMISQLELRPVGSVEDKRAAQMRTKLVRELPDLLRDPVVRRKLTADGAVILRLVGLALRGREEGDGLDDDATHFLESDFPLTFEEIGGATSVAKDLLSKFATLPQLKEAAVSMINEVLPAAEKRVAVSSQVDLVEIFREVRRALHSEKRQLALFVEDLTVLHGVEREFLDAIVEPTHSEDGDMCSLRMIFAVTEGHFDDLDTVRTRCDDAFWLDAPYGVDGVDAEEALAFVARYLNASRLDPAGIDTAWSNRGSNEALWLQNACSTCKHQEDCHDTFGASRDGYGLYPFNESAVARFVRALSTERFDPRDVVREVINRFLIQGSGEIRRDAFPSSAMLTTFDRNSDPIPPLIAAQVRSMRPVDYDRVGNILRYWSSEGSSVDITHGLLEAFGIADFESNLSTLRSLQSSGGQRDDGGRGRNRAKTSTNDGYSETSGGVEEQLKTKTRNYFEELKVWSSKQRELSASATKDLRKAVHEIVERNLEFGSYPVNLGADFDSILFRDSDIFIQGSVTQQSADSAIIIVERNQVNAAALQGLLLAKEIDLDDSPESAIYRRTLGTALENWLASVVAKLAEPVNPSSTALVEGAVVAATVLGELDANPTPGNYMAAIISNSETPAPSATRSGKWKALTAKAGDLRSRSRKRIEVEFGEARGKIGGVRLIQADRLSPVMAAFIADWKLDSADPSVAAFFRSVGPAVDEEWSTLGERVREALPLIDAEEVRSWADQTKQVLDVLEAATGAGRLADPAAIAALKALGEKQQNSVLRSLAEAAEALKKEVTLPEKLRLLASDLPDHVAVVHDFATRASKAIDGLEGNLAKRQAAEGDGSSLETAILSVAEATNRFDKAVKGLVR